MTVDDTIRRKIAARLLPGERCQVLWAGPGTGRLCVACDLPIGADATEYECDHADGTVIDFHYGCYVLWEAACRELESGSVI